MAEVKMGTLYRVVVTEYDDGVQRTDRADTKIFTTMEEANAYKAQWEHGGSRECYWRAEVTRMVA
jgi:hypothetical protein